MSDIHLGVSRKVPDRIYEYLREKIQTNAYQPGQKIPSESELVEDLNVSRNSLREAITRLEHEGYLVRKHGIGTFIIDSKVDRVNAAIDKLYSTSKLIASQGKIPGTADLTTHTTQADAFIASKLLIEPGSPVVCIQRKRTADGIPFCWDVSYFPVHPALQDQNALVKTTSLMDYVEKELGVKIDHAIATLKPAISDSLISEKLNIPVGTLMYIVEQVHFISNTKPIWFSRVWYAENAITVKLLVTW